MAWTIEFRPAAAKALKKLDRSTTDRILRHLSEQASAPNPRLHGKPLTGPLGHLWSYRVGDYRVLCDLIDDRMTILVIKIGDRKDVYR